MYNVGYGSAPLFEAHRGRCREGFENKGDMKMSSKLSPQRLIGLLGGLILVATLFAAPVSGAAPLRGHFLGDAFGNRANVKAGEIATQLGRSAYLPCPCLGTGGEIASNNIHNVRAGDVYQAGELVTTAQADKVPVHTAYVRMAARIVDVRALDGFITADAITAVARVDATASSMKATSTGSAFVNLRIGGIAIQVTPGQRINVPGFGYVVLNDVRKFGNGTTLKGIQVEMLRIVITRNNDLDIPIGAVLIVGHARAGYSRVIPVGFVSGAAWGSQATASTANIVNGLGRSAAVYMGCFSRGSQTKSNVVNATTVPGVLTTSVVYSELFGSVSTSVLRARALSRLTNVNLLGGLLTADVIKGVASATVNSTGGTASYAGSKFVDLRIQGVAIGDNIAPNTIVVLPGLGTLTLYATSSQSSTNRADASLFMVILSVSTVNSLGLPVGTEIRLGRARAGAER